MWFVLILIVLVILLLILVNYVLYGMSLNKIINIRLSNMKCLLAHKQLEISNLLERNNVDDLPYVKKIQLEISQIINKISVLEGYKKD